MIPVDGDMRGGVWEKILGLIQTTQINEKRTDERLVATIPDSRSPIINQPPAQPVGAKIISFHPV